MKADVLVSVIFFSRCFILRSDHWNMEHSFGLMTYRNSFHFSGATGTQKFLNNLYSQVLYTYRMLCEAVTC